MYYLGIIIYLLAGYITADKIGRFKKIGFAKTLLISFLFSPIVGYVFAEGSALKNPRGCNWCGNKDNEVEFCGLCGKNGIGEIDPHFNK